LANHIKYGLPFFYGGQFLPATGKLVKHRNYKLQSGMNSVTAGF